MVRSAAREPPTTAHGGRFQNVTLQFAPQRPGGFLRSGEKQNKNGCQAEQATCEPHGFCVARDGRHRCKGTSASDRPANAKRASPPARSHAFHTNAGTAACWMQRKWRSHVARAEKTRPRSAATRCARHAFPKTLSRLPRTPHRYESPTRNLQPLPPAQDRGDEEFAAVMREPRLHDQPEWGEQPRAGPAARDRATRAEPALREERAQLGASGARCRHITKQRNQSSRECDHNEPASCSKARSISRVSTNEAPSRWSWIVAKTIHRMYVSMTPNRPRKRQQRA